MLIRASEMQRRYLCPGSLIAEEAVRIDRARRGVPPASSAFASHGTAIHAALADTLGRISRGDTTFQYAIATEDDYEVRLGLSTIAEWCGDLTTGRALIEYDLQYKAVKGTIDFGFLREPDIPYVVDYKSLGAADRDEAASNMQTGCYALLVARRFPHPDGVRVMIVAPSCPIAEERVTHADYSVEDLAEFERLADSVAVECMASNAPRVPSWAACKYCNARGTAACAESIDAVDSCALMLRGIAPTLDQIGAAICVLPAEQLAVYADRIKQVEPIMKLIQESFKAAVLAGEIEPEHWAVVKGGTTKAIKLPSAFFAEHWRLFGRTQKAALAAYLACCKPSVSALSDAYAATHAADGKTKKAMYGEFLDAVQPDLAITEREPSLRWRG